MVSLNLLTHCLRLCNKKVSQVIRAAIISGRSWQETLVDGPGVRLVLFLSGCSHNCFGCQNLWLCDPDAGELLREQELVDELLLVYHPDWHDGITISGGDPFYQRFELATLLSMIRERIPSINVWLYTGYLYEAINEEPALQYCDVLVDGPFIATRANEGQLFCGSGNQRIIHLT
jgi:anaerobic ribonucleoside-triphosphate reductase activating protein